MKKVGCHLETRLIHCDLRMLHTNHMRVLGDWVEPNCPYWGIHSPFVVNGHVTNAHVAPWCHIWCHSVIEWCYIDKRDDVLQTQCVQSVSPGKYPKMAIILCNLCNRVHRECWVYCMMPHPPLHIWVHPHDRSLQLLYLPIFYITMARLFYHKINREYIADASTLHLLMPLVTVLTHPGEAHMQASTLQVVQLKLRDTDLHCVCTRRRCGDHRDQWRHSPCLHGWP